MTTGETVAVIIVSVIAVVTIITQILKCKAKKTTYEATLMSPIETRKMGFYERFIKRFVDVFCSICAIVVFSPILIVVAILVKTKLGSPVLFTQDRPGLIGKDGKETVLIVA